jgi:prepilin-type N-terminal cleavage/methylation domain-containing protein
MGTKNNRNNAFTLVELLITLSIVVILAVVAMLYLRGQAFKGNDARRKADIERIKVAVEEYEKDHDCYPLYVNCGVVQDQPIYPYLNDVPCDPVTNSSYTYDFPDNACPAWYRFFSDLEFDKDPDAMPGIGPNNAYNYVSGSPNAPISEPYNPSSTSSPGGGGESGFYGCRAGVCVPIDWNENRPGPECDPSFQNSNCYGQCNLSPGLECIMVN